MKKLIILLFAFTLAACDLQGSLFSSEPNYEGVYGRKVNVEPIIKITKLDGKYFMSTKEYWEEAWSTPREATAIPREVLKLAHGNDFPDSASGLWSGSAQVIITPKGTLIGGHKVDTGYFGGTGETLTRKGELVKLD